AWRSRRAPSCAAGPSGPRAYCVRGGLSFWVPRPWRTAFPPTSLPISQKGEGPPRSPRESPPTSQQLRVIFIRRVTQGGRKPRAIRMVRMRALCPKAEPLVNEGHSTARLRLLIPHLPEPLHLRRQPEGDADVCVHRRKGPPHQDAVLFEVLDH